MKRLCAVVVVLVMAGGAVYSAGPFFGAKAGVGIGFHGNGKDMEDMVASIESVEGVSVDETSGVAFALSPYLGYYFTDKLAVQTEVNFMFGQKKIWEISFGGFSGEITGKYTSLDVPVLLRFDFINRPALFGALAGPYLSIPLGDIEISAPAALVQPSSLEVKPDGVTLGVALGLYGGYPIGPGRIIGDVRFILDFNSLKGKDSGQTMELIKRRGITVTAGYEISLGGN
ncbi:MAG: PorT family protein [Spirochaetaceae bacterium]|nr:PorT family protein [Spirochaetaceae bacterium]